MLRFLRNKVNKEKQTRGWRHGGRKVLSGNAEMELEKENVGQGIFTNVCGRNVYDVTNSLKYALRVNFGVKWFAICTILI